MENFSPLRIFLVDDDPFCLRMFQKAIRGLGYEDLYVYDNGTDCLLDMVKQPDVVFLDHGMDILNGIEVLKKIKRFNPEIFVIFISGQDDVETAVNSLKYGAFDYIVKGSREEVRIMQVLEKVHVVRDLTRRKPKGVLSKLFFKV